MGGICDSDTIAESMNEFFCSIGNIFSDKIPKTLNPLLENEYSVNPENIRFEFEAINVSQLERGVSKFKTSKGVFFWAPSENGRVGRR